MFRYLPPAFIADIHIGAGRKRTRGKLRFLGGVQIQTLHERPPNKLFWVNRNAVKRNMGEPIA